MGRRRRSFVGDAAAGSRADAFDVAGENPGQRLVRRSPAVPSLPGSGMGSPHISKERVSGKGDILGGVYPDSHEAVIIAQASGIVPDQLVSILAQGAKVAVKVWALDLVVFAHKNGNRAA